MVYSKRLTDASAIRITVVCIRAYGAAVLLYGCNDGNIYAIDKRTGTDICTIDGDGKALLSFVLIKDKVSFECSGI